MTSNSSYISSPVAEQYLCSPFPFLSLFFQKEYSLQPKCPGGGGKPRSGGSGESSSLCSPGRERLGCLLTPSAAEPLAGKHGWDGGKKSWDVERSKMRRGGHK